MTYSPSPFLSGLLIGKGFFRVRPHRRALAWSVPYEPPLKIKRIAEAFVDDAGGLALAYVYFDDRRGLVHLAQRPDETKRRNSISATIIGP